MYKNTLNPHPYTAQQQQKLHSKTNTTKIIEYDVGKVFKCPSMNLSTHTHTLAENQNLNCGTLAVQRIVSNATYAKSHTNSKNLK